VLQNCNKYGFYGQAFQIFMLEPTENGDPANVSALFPGSVHMGIVGSVIKL
jgi:hypothetical protein